MLNETVLFRVTNLFYSITEKGLLNSNPNSNLNGYLILLVTETATRGVL